MIRQEYANHIVTAKGLKPGDCFNGNVIAFIARDVSFDNKYPEDGAQCNFVKFVDGTRAYLDRSATHLSVYRELKKI